MSERALRGSRLGATSYETDRDIELAPRQVVEYACPKGHNFHVPFSAEAKEVPVVWECRVCGNVALRADNPDQDDKKAKPARTHWDMLMERRTRESSRRSWRSAWPSSAPAAFRATRPPASRRSPGQSSSTTSPWMTPSP